MEFLKLETKQSYRRQDPHGTCKQDSTDSPFTKVLITGQNNQNEERYSHEICNEKGSAEAPTVLTMRRFNEGSKQRA